MSYVALYRKFRPQQFSDVKGQEHITTTLKNEIIHNRIGHAYLFTGTRGTGKTTVAKIFAKAVNCEHPMEDGSPCGECPTCQAIAAGNSMNVIEIDAASNNGVSNIRDIIEEVTYAPTEGKYKVYIIDEVHMLSTGAFNALLKTLEEPPAYVIFILATTEVQKIPITVLSRCQRYDFRRISIDTIADRMKDLMQQESVEVEEKALRYIAKTADGSMRDALSLLDQCIAFYLGQKLTYDDVLKVLGAVDTTVFSRLLRAILAENVKDVIALIEEVIIQGREPGQFIIDFTWYLRNLLLAKSMDQMEDILDISTDNLKLMKEEAAMVKEDDLMRYIRVMSELTSDLRFATQKRVLIEIAMIRLCHPQMDEDYSSLTKRMDVIEKKMEEGTFVTGGTGANFNPASVSAQENATQVQKQPLPKAVPEEVQMIAQKWSEIQGEAEGLLRIYLGRGYPSVNPDGKLILIFDAADYEQKAAYDMLKQEEYQKDIAGLFEEYIGKSVSFELKLNENAVPREQQFPDIITAFARQNAIDIVVENFTEE